MDIVKLDCRGLCCPEPLTILRNAVRAGLPGQVFELLSDDPVSLRDIPAFCKFMNHTLVSLPDEKIHVFSSLKERIISVLKSCSFLLKSAIIKPLMVKCNIFLFSM